jgi:predicted membrane protein
METQNNTPTTSPSENNNQNNFGRGRALGGLIIVIVGVLLFAREVGAEIPRWIFSWQMFLIGVGIYVGARHNFRQYGWMIPIAIGVTFLIEDIVPDLQIRAYLWPMIIIGIGVVMILRSRSKNRDDLFRRWERNASDVNRTTEGFFESVTIFGENKKQILSKDFKGGESVCVFGGTEINLTQADINGRVGLELVQVFGGTKLIVPGHWKIETEEMVSIFGGLNDKRQILNTPIDNTKVLVLKGMSMFGGIDIKSF